MQHIYSELKEYGSVRLNEPMSKHTTFKIGGPADFFITVNSIDTCVSLLTFLDEKGVPHFIVGGGSNMLFCDEGFRGVVIQIKDKSILIEGGLVKAAAGAGTVEVARASVKAGLTGFEWGVGVPGSIGGAVRGNAGAMGGEVEGSIEKVEVYMNGEIQKLTKQECGFAYRSSIFKREGGIILRVWLRLEPADSAGNGMKKALAALKYRNETQPKGFASTGCIFKNIEADEASAVGEKNRELLRQHFGDDDEKVQRFLDLGKISAGWLIQEAGLKGKTLGGAQVSDVHANFIVNIGEAKASDVLSLIDEIKLAVYTMYGIELEEEIQVVHQ